MLFTDNVAQPGPQLAVGRSKRLSRTPNKLGRLPAQLEYADKVVRGVARAPKSGYRPRNSPITTANDGLAMML